MPSNAWPCCWYIGSSISARAPALCSQPRKSSSRPGPAPKFGELKFTGELKGLGGDWGGGGGGGAGGLAIVVSHFICCDCRYCWISAAMPGCCGWLKLGGCIGCS